MPKISVLIPVYNAERYVARCLDSVLRQSFSDLEIIVGDDGSTDGSPAIIKEYSSRDDRIRIVSHEKNKGIMLMRKTLIDESNGDYILFVDSDDTVDEGICEILYSNAIRQDADLSICGVNQIKSDGSVVPFVNKLSYGSSSNDVLMSFLTRELWHSLWARLFDKHLLKDHPIYFDSKYIRGEDMYINYSIVRYIRKAVCVPDRLYNYYENSGSMMNSVSREQFIDGTIKESAFRVEFAKSLDDNVQTLVSRSEIRILFNLLKQGVDRQTLWRLVGENGLSWLLSFKNLKHSLGLRKAISYWLVFRFDTAARIVARSN